MGDVLILCYHAVSESWPSELAIRPADLERQVQVLRRRGYTPTTFTRAVTAPPSRRCFAVTFDDGYRSVAELALPLLRELDVQGTLFVPTQHVGSERPMAWPGIDQWVGTQWERELVPVDWPELLRLQEAGWEIGSHSVSHPYLTQLDDEALAEELEQSRERVRERLGDCVSIAYPYGDVDQRVISAAGRAGYRTGAALPERYLVRRELHSLAWPRLMVGRDHGSGMFRRRSSVPYRRLQESVAWRTATLAARAVRRVYRGRGGEPYPGLRVLGEPLTLARGRARAAALLAVPGRPPAHALWPSLEAPVFVLPILDRAVSTWVQRTFEPKARRAPHVWHLLRARAALRSTPAHGAVLAAAHAALGREPERPRVALYSPSGARLAKVTAFVFERDEETPSLVVKAMATPSQRARLQHESDVVEALRDRLRAAPEVQAALPLAPLWRGELDGEVLLAQPVDPMAGHHAGVDDAVAVAWLRRFQSATERARTAWSAADTDRALASVRQAWGFARPRTGRAMVAAIARRLRDLEGEEAPVCAVHGDFWRGNLAAVGDALRVYDWEWARLEGRPFLDVWTYELADLERSTAGVADDRLAEWCANRGARIEQQLRERGLDPRFALATLAPSLAELSFRVRILTGMPGGNEAGARRLMAALEELLA